MVGSMPRPHCTPRKDPVPILQEAGWAPGPFWTGGKSDPHRDLIPDCPARSQSLYRLSYPAHTVTSTRAKEPGNRISIPGKDTTYFSSTTYALYGVQQATVTRSLAIRGWRLKLNTRSYLVSSLRNLGNIQLPICFHSVMLYCA